MPSGAVFGLCVAQLAQFTAVKRGTSRLKKVSRFRHKDCKGNRSPMFALQRSPFATRVFRMTWPIMASLGLVHVFTACGGDVASDTGAVTGGAGGAVIGSSASGQATGGSSGILHTPMNHRAASSTCPAQRGPGSVSVDSSCYSNSIANISCVRDSDCTAGTNGRCDSGGPIACQAGCSYDTCFSDADCPSNQPCECRQTDSDSAVNTCETGGNCRIDADCGQGGYCSPSQVNNFCFCPSPALCGPDDGYCSPGPCSCGDSCGHGYFCHTPTDTCVDDSDCGGGTCNFDTVANRWSCAVCWPVP